MSKAIFSIEDECVEAIRGFERMFVSQHGCDGCHKDTPKRYSVSGRCVGCKASGAKNTTDIRNYHNPSYNELKRHNEAKGINLMLDVFDTLQRKRNVHSAKQQ